VTAVVSAFEITVFLLHYVTAVVSAFEITVFLLHIGGS